MSDNIKVVVKVRPLISRELEEKLSYQWRVKNNTLYQLDQNGKEFGTCFTFDKVYDKDTKTCDIYNDIAKPIVEAAIAGFNGTIFAYGQTSSGKTYTMSGTENSPGIIPLAVCNLFQIIKKIPDRDFLVRVSYIEIYNETLRDLLNVDKKNVKVHETLQGVKVDCTEQVTTSPEEVLKYLKEGEANRQTGATNMNEESSRSHSIFQITIESREHIEGEEEVGCVNVSQLNLVDLAGSERAGQTGATGLRFKEGTHINKSLSVLALVINKLSEGQIKHVNYRDSKLTRILQNSLGGNAKTSIICAITPAAVEETISTLQFANRAKAIKNKPEVNAVATDATMIQSLTKQLSKLQSQLESKKNLEVMLESRINVEHNLQKQIAALQRLILNGFGTRSSMDMMTGTRRKLVPPRRVTISTLHPIDEDPVPSVPKFHTPLLKYNPMLMPNSTDFVPIQNANKLSSLPEECENRLVTPPPPDKKVNVNDEIIELDSDDDNSTLDMQTCSPYHKCYGSSKTPPCVLRKHAKLAEKNLKDIVELTEREKIYTPNVIELIEKLERNTTVITSLEDEVNALNRKSKEKDLEIDQLKVKLSKSNDEIKMANTAKVEMEALCKEYTTKLTDWEVSYETLKTKTKRREDELLSLVEEQKSHKPVEDIGKLSEKPVEKELNFMDMSKDISLVNSEYECSMTNINDHESVPLAQDLLIDIQNQLASKTQSVVELEAELSTQKQKILSLQNSSHEMQKIVDDFKEKVNLLENENSLLKSSVETLNSTIKSQKSNLESATSDIESYNSLIQELQIKLRDKENIANLIINENTLEKMIANEEKFIANNENMRNIIHSFKIALETRNKEIECLKSAVGNNSISSDNSSLQDQLALKEKEIETLNEKTKLLQDQIDGNIILIDKLMHENNCLKNLEIQLTSELETITNKYSELEQISTEKDTRIDSLNMNIEELLHSISDKDSLEKELSKKHADTIQCVEELNKKVLDLQEDIRVKDNLINMLNTQDTQHQEYIYIANSLINSMHSLISKISGNTHDLPKPFDNLNDVFSSLKDNLHTLEFTTEEILAQKDLEINKYIELNSNLEASNTNFAKEISNFKSSIEELHKSIQENELLKQEMNALIDNLRQEIETRNSEIIVLKTSLKDTEEKNENLCSDILSKDTILSSLGEKENSLHSEIDQLKREREQITNEFKQQLEILTMGIESKEKSMEAVLQEKETKINTLESNLTDLEQSLYNKSTEIENLHHKLDESIANRDLDLIVHHATELASSLKIELAINTNISTYENIITLLKIISTQVNTKYSEVNEKVDVAMLEAQDVIKKMNDDKQQLLNQVSELDTTNNYLLSQLEEIKLENKMLNQNMSQRNEMLEVLRTELNQKGNEIENMVTKTQELKDHFDGLGIVMKEQINDLRTDNEKLTARCSELEINLNNVNIQHLYNDSDTDYEDMESEKTTYEPVLTGENNSPPSLLTICCNKIVEAIQPNENSATSSDSNTTIDQSRRCDCDKLTKELRLVESENKKLLNTVQDLKTINHNLIFEQEQVRQEVQLLLEPAYELQKRISNHKTNLSTLTATTYAENKSLQSQVKVLQHHHSRFHKVCQRDLPVVKKQLYELMTMLKGESSFSDKHNVSFKRYSLPSVLPDNNSTLNNLKNESTLDGDLLMLDTNLTLTTTADNTLMGFDQTCLELTQVYSGNEVGCQTCELSHINIDETRVENYDSNQKLLERVEALEVENEHLRQMSSEAQSSPIKVNSSTVEEQICKECEDLKQIRQLLEQKCEQISQQLSAVENQKNDIEKKYSSLSLEVPSTDALLKRINIFEKELKGRVQEITKLTNLLNSKNEELKQLQQENDALSTQVMDNISETDDLSKELDIVKDANVNLTRKCCDLEKLLLEAQEESKLKICQCQTKDVVVDSLQNMDVHSKLNRSLSDSDTSSRYNKICTLQNELHAGREDCKELSEEVTVIKNHLERSNLSMGQNMDLDDSMGESNIFSFSKHFDSVGSPLNKFSVSNTTQERQSDVYALDKVDCINYFVEKTGADKENFDCNVKIIDVLKMFYTNFVMKHNNEVENLVNKIKCYEESRNQLESHVKELSTEYTNVSNKLAEKEKHFQTVTNTLSQIKQNITLISEEISVSEGDDARLVTFFKDTFLKTLDNEFAICSVPLFENLIDTLVTKHQNELAHITDQYTKLQARMDVITAELDAVNDNQLQMKSQLTEKENEYNLLKAQKEKIREISNAVTLDIVKKEQALCETIMNRCKELDDNNIICPSDIDMNMPVSCNINILFDRLIKELKNQIPEKETLSSEIKKHRTELEENQKVLERLKVENDKLKEINRTVTLDLVDKNSKLEIQNSVNEDLNRKYDTLVKENKSVALLVEKRSEEIETLKESLLEKEAMIQNIDSNKNLHELSQKEAKLAELLEAVESFKQEIYDLKRINEVITKEKETAALELEECRALLKTNTAELDKVTGNILVLREAVKENVSMIESLKQEAKSLLQQNIHLKEQFDAKCGDCSRLEMNIKTHEKTAEIQSKMIMRLQKQKEEDDKVITDKNKRLEELTEQISALKKDSETLRSNLKVTREELDKIRMAKEALELRLSKMELDLEKINKPRLSVDATSDSTRRRRRSIHDSKRIFTDNQDFTDNNQIEAVFESRAKPVDLFMDVDEHVVHSNRSTPLRSSKGRDSLLSRHDQSDETPSRPSSVAETRRRRQSIHDLHRSGVRQTPSPHERPSSKLSESNNRKSTDVDNNNMQSEVGQLRERLSACQQELEELKEQYRELDEECETCAQHLRERDDQCSRLKKEKAALQNLVTELKDKLHAMNPNRSQQEPKATFSHAAVNTDEDWANLHSVVVDRMSFDAEVEKNKRLTKTIEELRFKKLDLKMTLAKMQKALEKNATRDHSKELELTKSELKSCKQELKELQEKYRELDEECETCSAYLEERDEQCRKLKKEKAALEAKLQECGCGGGGGGGGGGGCGGGGGGGGGCGGGRGAAEARRRRRSAHDRLRGAPPLADAATQMTDEFLNNQVERDSGSKKSNDDKTEEFTRLKMAVTKLSQQKAALEQQLAAISAAPAPNPMYIATGSAIVQNQQLTDVMKENQKLKKINTKLIDICKKRGKKPEVTIEDISEHGMGQ